METSQSGHLRAAIGEALNRRSFLVGAAAGLLAGCGLRQAVTLGVQSYSFRDRSLDDAIAGMQKLGLHNCELWQGHVEPRRVARDEMRHWRETVALDVFTGIGEKLARASIALSAYNISIHDDFTDAELERGFEMTKALGAPLITSSSTPSTVPRLASAAERHKMLVGVHNHSRIDPNEFATAHSLTGALDGGRFMAVNLDIGHFTAANGDAVEFLTRHHERIVTLHIKDRKRDQGPHVAMGEGDAPIVAVLKLLRDRQWAIPANIEYEYEGGDSVEQVGKCLDYCRRALDS